MNLTTTTFRPCCNLGSMCRHGVKTSISVGIMESSPFLVLPGWPLTPTISPRRIWAMISANSFSDFPGSLSEIQNVQFSIDLTEPCKQPCWPWSEFWRPRLSDRRRQVWHQKRAWRRFCLQRWWHHQAGFRRRYPYTSRRTLACPSKHETKSRLVLVSRFYARFWIRQTFMIFYELDIGTRPCRGLSVMPNLSE